MTTYEFSYSDLHSRWIQEKERAEKAEAALETAKANALAILAMKQTSDEECARLEAENATLQAAITDFGQKNEGWRVECARLEAQAEKFCETIERLGPECARFRYALELISQPGEPGWKRQRIARAALEAK